MALETFYKNYSTFQNTARYELLKNFIKGIDIKSHLDVGAFDGLGLETIGIKERYAVEPSQYGRSLLKEKNISIISENFEDYDGHQQFDLITWFDVLEHVFSPLDSLKKSFRLLKPGGYLGFTIPNDVMNIKNLLKLFSPFKRAPVFEYTSGHIRFFDYGSCIRISKEAGFEIVHSQGYGRIKYLAKLLPNSFGYGYFFLLKKNEQKI